MKQPENARLTTEDIAATRKAVPENVDVEDEVSESRQAWKGDEPSPLFAPEVEKEFRARWSNVQTGFVDEPRKAVEMADELVAQVMKHLAQSFSDQRSALERRWEKSEQASTEDLRLALRRYRSFFDRLLSI